MQMVNNHHLTIYLLFNINHLPFNKFYIYSEAKNLIYSIILFGILFLKKYFNLFGKSSILHSQCRSCILLYHTPLFFLLRKFSKKIIEHSQNILTFVVK